MCRLLRQVQRLQTRRSMPKLVRLHNQLALSNFTLKLDDRAGPDLQRSSLNRTNGHYFVHKQRFRFNPSWRPHGSIRQKICPFKNPFSDATCAPDVARLSKFTHDLPRSYFAWFPVLNQIEQCVRLHDWEFALGGKTLVLRLPVRNWRFITDFPGLPLVDWLDELAHSNYSQFISHVLAHCISEDLFRREPWVPLLERIVRRAWRFSFRHSQAKRSLQSLSNTVRHSKA